MTQTLTLIRPDDWHVHLRDHAALAYTVPATANHFARAIVMPNLNPPIQSITEAIAYCARIKQHIPVQSTFTPLMTLYLTQQTTVSEVIEAKASGCIYAYKLYPAGATTHSHHGVTDILKMYPIFAALEEIGLPLLIHGEVVDADIDIFDREAIFITRTLQPMLAQFPRLKVVLEHITTQQAVQFIEQSEHNIAATITPQHLLYNRNHLLVGGIKPHFYCLPILKRDIHQTALIKAATSGSHQFFLGTDSAPHAASTKHSACGCAGCFSAPFAMSLYAQVFEQANALDKLEGFASFYGADFYGIARNTTTLTLTKSAFKIPTSSAYIDGDHLVHLGEGEDMLWQVVNDVDQIPPK